MSALETLAIGARCSEWKNKIKIQAAVKNEPSCAGSRFTLSVEMGK